MSEEKRKSRRDRGDMPSSRVRSDNGSLNTDKTKSASTKANGSKANGSKANGASRPSVIPLNYPDRASLQKAYMPFVKGGGLFLPTSTNYGLHEEVFLLVTLPDSKKSLPVPGSVVWQSPDNGMDGRKQGVGIEFKGREGNGLRNQIEGILGAKVSSSTETYTM